MSTPQPSPSPDPADPPEAPRDLHAGVNLTLMIAHALIQNGVTEATADRVADRVVAEIASHDVIRDDAGRVWAQLPVYDAEGNALPFDSRNVATLEHAAAHVLMTSPEAVAVFGGLVYPSAFREAKIARVMWLGRGGEVTGLPDIFNSLDSIALLHEGMFIRLQQRKLHEQSQLALLLSQKKDAYEQQHGPGGAAPQGEAAGEAGAGEGPRVGQPEGDPGDREPR